MFLDDIVGQSEVVRVLKAFADNPQPRCFLFIGTPGIGKTHTSQALAADLSCFEEWSGRWQVRCADFSVDAAREMFGRTLRLRFDNRGQNVLILEELEWISPQCQRFLKDALAGRRSGKTSSVVSRTTLVKSLSASRAFSFSCTVPSCLEESTMSTKRLPKYARHASGKARVRYNGKDIYLPGEYGSAESLAAHDRLCEQIRIEQAAKAAHAARPTITVCTVNQLTARYLDHARQYYAGNAAEIAHLTAVARLLELSHGQLPADHFTPLHLDQVRQMMVDGGWKYATGTVAEPWCRRTVNQCVRRIQRLFRWGVSKMLVRPDTAAALEALDPLHAGRTTAAESEPVTPVPWETVQATLPELGTTITDMVLTQWHTGMRPGEVCRMTPTGLDVSREGTDGIWLYRPPQHKNTWRNKTRLVVLGPRAIAILKPRMPISLEAPFFRTPDGSRYSTTTYRQAIQRAARRAGIEPWHPHQIRHSKATLVEQQFGREAAANALGDTIETTEVYADRNLGQMIEVARLTG